MEVGIEAEYLDKFSFAASTSYSTMSNSITQQDSVFSETKCSHTIMSFQLQQPFYLELSDGAQRYVDMMTEPLPGNHEWGRVTQMPQWRLIEEYGTDYFHRAEIGGRYQKTYKIDKSFLEQYDEVGIEVAVEAQANFATGSIGASVDTSSFGSNFLQDFQQSESTYEHYYGGQWALMTPEHLRDHQFFSDWQRATYAQPWMVKGDMKDISELISDPQKQAWVAEAREQYIFRQFVNSATRLNVNGNDEAHDLIQSLQNRRISREEVEHLRNLLCEYICILLIILDCISLI